MRVLTIFAAILTLTMALPGMLPAQIVVIPGTGGGGIGLDDLATYSVEDATVELGEEFDLPVTIASDEALGFATLRLEVDEDLIHIVDWRPGEALQDYLDENGDIPCDAFVTCDAIDIFMSFFEEDFDPAEWGDEFVIIECLVVAQDETDTPVTVANGDGEEDDASIEIEGGTALDEIPECEDDFGFPFDFDDPAAYSMDDVTTELGAEFDLEVTIELDEASSLTSMRVTVDDDEIQIVDWSPGPALEAYLDDNGPIPCDAFQTCGDLDILMSFLVPFDAEEYGTDFVTVHCLAVAQEETDSTATVSNDTNDESADATVTFEGGTALEDTECESNTGGGFPIDFGSPDLAADDTTAELDGEWELSIDATADDEVFVIDLDVSVDTDELEITEIEHGEGLESYIDDNGPLALEFVSQDDGSAWVLIVLDDGLDTTVYGTDLLRVKGNVVADEAVDSVVELNTVDGDPTDVTVSVVERETEEFLMLRGDPGADGDCTLADAIGTLEFLFADGTLACEDAADWDDNGRVSMPDPLGLMRALFVDQEPLDDTCRADDTDDSLPCDTSGC